jgi:hypothetical protein
MNSLVRQFFLGNEERPFKEVIFLNEESNVLWEDVSVKSPRLPRGWFELSRVKVIDRIEFTRDFWLDRMPYHPVAHPAFYEFFEQLDDVIVVLMRKRDGDPFESQLIYSMADNSTFFRGNPPCKEKDLEEFYAEIEVALPYDYTSFMRIHDGFGKLSEMGLLEVEDLSYARRRVMDLCLQMDERISSRGKIVDPGALIPFYEVLGLSSFQCFFKDWYPGSEMGNVYLSGIDYTISDLSDRKAWSENLAFPTFSDWLVQYLQGMNLCLT